MAALLPQAALAWPSFLSGGVVPTTNRALFGAAADCEAPLAFLAPRLHLISFATGDDLLMVRHFVSHYSRLGVTPGHMRFFVFGSGSGSGGGEAVVRYLHAHGAVQSRLMTTRYNDTYKLSLINSLLRALPEDAWAATPDVDELYHYPCASLPRLIEQGIDLFCGYMEDMLADSGGLERLRAQPDIQAQYPHRCRVRAFLKHFTTYKVVLARVRPPALGGVARQFRSVHAFTTTAATYTSRDCHAPNQPLVPLNGSRAGRSTRVDVGPLSHYSLTRQQLLHTINKAELHKRNHEERLRSGVVDGANNWTPCGSFAKDEPASRPLAQRRCIDYERILYAVSLIYMHSRGEAAPRIAKVCHLPANVSKPVASSSVPWEALVQRKANASAGPPEKPPETELTLREENEALKKELDVLRERVQRQESVSCRDTQYN